MNQRIDTIRSLLAKSPDDVFLHYSLGMELLSAERFDEAAAAFNECIELDEQYLPAYVEAGKASRSAGRAEAAGEYFTRAMALAGRLGDTHAQDAIRQQLEGLGL